MDASLCDRDPVFTESMIDETKYKKASSLEGAWSQSRAKTHSLYWNKPSSEPI